VPNDILKGSNQRGLQLGILIGISWFVTLFIGLRMELNHLHPLLIIAWILSRSFLHTGLFILGHDAMHNSLAPGHGLINQRAGQLCLWLYAGLNYDDCKANHRKHHLMPESEADPDYCPMENPSVLAWLIRFLRSYLNPAQFARLGIILMSLLIAGKAHGSNSLINAFATYLLPLLISTAQLFFVGTYLPHRKGRHQRVGKVSTKSLNLHPFLSFLACYHFGYHCEHHNNPKTPWFLLPELRTARFAH
jgi:beta-carotene ketolase (CrtW type)